MPRRYKKFKGLVETTRLMDPDDLANLLGVEFCAKLLREALNLEDEPMDMSNVELSPTPDGITFPLHALLTNKIRFYKVEGTPADYFQKLQDANFHTTPNGFWLRKGVCITTDCPNRRHNADRGGYCQPCKIRLGMIKPPPAVKAATISHAKEYVPPATRVTPAVAQDEFVDKIKDFMCAQLPIKFADKTLALWHKFPLTLKLEIVNSMMENKDNVITMPEVADDMRHSS